MQSLLVEATLALGSAQALHDALTPEEREWLKYSWEANARPLVENEDGSYSGQLLPPGDWATCLFLAGRRCGKGWTGAHACIREAEDPSARIAICGATARDVRKIQINGPSGILALSPPNFRPDWYPTDQALRWPNGAIAYCYSAEEPDRLRGPEHSFFWGDEIRAWPYPEAFDMLLMTMSGGSHPRGFVSTTPDQSRIIKDLLADKTTVVMRGTTYDNRIHLPRAYYEKLISRFEGTRLGRQELEGLLLDQVEGALWTHDLIDKHRVAEDPGRAGFPQHVEMTRIIISVDPAGLTYSAGAAASEEPQEGAPPGPRAAKCGIVVIGLGRPKGAKEDHCYILDDGSVCSTPAVWGAKVVELYDLYQADRIIYENTHGGKDVEKVIGSVRHGLPFKGIVARRGKYARAEPIQSYYEKGRIHHVAGRERPTRKEGGKRGDLTRSLAYLEDQMCQWTPESSQSPDRMDALVHGVTSMLGVLERGEAYFH